MSAKRLKHQNCSSPNFWGSSKCSESAQVNKWASSTNVNPKWNGTQLILYVHLNSLDYARINISWDNIGTTLQYISRYMYSARRWPRICLSSLGLDKIKYSHSRILLFANSFYYSYFISLPIIDYLQMLLFANMDICKCSVFPNIYCSGVTICEYLAIRE